MSGSGYEIKAELRRLALARFDIDAARDTCLLLEARGSIEGLDWGSQAWGLWTGVVVSYARPFKHGTLELKGAQWRTFDDPDLQEEHDRLLELRDTLFAHNDATRWRKVIVLPPAPPGRLHGTTTEEQSTFNVRSIPRVKALCQFQRDRIEARIGKIVDVLCAGRSWPLLTMLELGDLPDKL